MSAFDPSCIDVPDMLDCLEIRNISEATTEEIRFSCPFPNHENGDENASAYMNADTSAFFCHGCKERGNAIQFTSAVLGISPLESIRLLKERYMPGYLNPDAVSMVEEVRKILNAQEDGPAPQPVLEEDVLGNFAMDWNAAQDAWESGDGFPASDYMFERGFSAAWLEKWEFGYDPTFDRITFAVRDEHGRLIGFKGRAYDGREPKYLVLGDKPTRKTRYGWPCYFTSRVVYGAHRITTETDLVVCEGELNVVALDQKCDVPAVAINGSHFTADHALIIRRIARSVTLFMDTDTAGEDAVNAIVKHLNPFMPVRIVPPHDGDPADMQPDEIHDALGRAESALALSIR